jgi:hypothetical protein
LDDIFITDPNQKSIQANFYLDFTKSNSTKNITNESFIFVPAKNVTFELLPWISQVTSQNVIAMRNENNLTKFELKFDA